jgi:hypothetical protein
VFRPSALIVAGDPAYNDVHPYLVESNEQTSREWIAELDTIESLKPCAVIAGHKKPEKDDNPGIIEESRRYIRDFERLAETNDRARALRHDAGALSASRQFGLAMGISPRRKEIGV